MRNGRFYVRDGLQVTVSLDFHYKHMIRYKRNYGKHYTGDDVNVDRISLAIVDEGSRIRDVKTFWSRRHPGGAVLGIELGTL